MQYRNFKENILKTEIVYVTHGHHLKVTIKSKLDPIFLQDIKL